MDQEHVDSLLERYLSLLDEYTRLRDRLSKLQSDVYHNIARANFSAERGLRYGQDQYDERMQASRILKIEAEDDGSAPRFSLVDTAAKPDDGDSKGREEGDKEDDGNDGKEDKAPKPVDPLRWFGILAPMPLRNAQGLSIETAEQVIPRLVTVAAEMFSLEIEVRRARKKRSKAELLKAKSDAAASEPGSAEKHTTATSVDSS